jgi:NAD(P)-dependent dehydrogenase (short-subunit alcohol dehydrogenase family)
MSHPLFDVTGRVALVSGAAQNLGRSSTLALAEAGADLLIVDVNGPGVERTAEEVRSMGRRAVAMTCDITDETQIREMFRRLDDEFGRIDVVANIAGSAVGGHPEDLTVQDFIKTLQGTLVGKFICCQEAGKRMLVQGKGSIINMSSIGGIRALGRAHLPYSVAQAGVIQLTRELAVEWGDRGVRINAIAPAQMTNPAFEIRMNDTQGLRETYLRGIPLQRLGVPEDIKGLVLFLASDASAFITGAVFPLDGGNTAMGANGTIGHREA